MMWTLKKAQEYTGLPYSVLRELCVNNKIRYIRSGTKYYVYSQSLIQYLTGEKEGAEK